MSSLLLDADENGGLTAFGLATLRDRYFLPGEDFDDMVRRVAHAYADDKQHEDRLIGYISKLWFMPSTPVLSNGGTERGLPISCFLNEVEDSLKGIVDIWMENVWLASRGGGIGTYWGNVRSIGEKLSNSGNTSGIVPFIKVMDSMTLAISQGSLRRGSAAVYLSVDHPEILEFVDIRKPTGGDHNRRTLNIHHAVCIPDEFMRAVEKDLEWELKSPQTKKVVATTSARGLWIKILSARMEIGEPYLFFSDTVSAGQPEFQRKLGIKVRTSNLCNEITLPTGVDHLGKTRTAICCLSSLNLEYFDQWKDNPLIIEDALRFLDNVLDDFTKRAPPEMKNAIYSVSRSRDIGLGVMGFGSYLQSKMVPFESATAKAMNLNMFKRIREQADVISEKLGKERGPCLDAKEAGMNYRFSHVLAIAPTASISVIAGESSPCIEPYTANVYTQKTLSGSFVVINKHLKRLLKQKGELNDENIISIAAHTGSVAHLGFLTDDEKKVFKTAYEIDQMWVIEHAADRAPYIHQGQSLNVFLNGDVHKKYLHRIHYSAWKKGLKGMYYCRSTAVSRADNVSQQTELFEFNGGPSSSSNKDTSDVDYDECLSCQ